MHKRPVITALAAPLVLLVACGGGAQDLSGPPVPATEVAVEDYHFSSPVIQVDAGTTVTWTWEGDQPHDVAFDDGTASATQESGTWTRRFDTPGSYEYLCRIHPEMRGRVVVV